MGGLSRAFRVGEGERCWGSPSRAHAPGRSGRGQCCSRACRAGGKVRASRRRSMFRAEGTPWAQAGGQVSPAPLSGVLGTGWAWGQALGPSGAGCHPGAAGSLGPELGGGTSAGKPLGRPAQPPGAAPASSKRLRLLAWSQLGHGGRGEGARLPAPGTVPLPVPAQGATLTQPEEPYLAPAPPPSRPVTAMGSPPLRPGPTPTAAPHPGGRCQAPGPSPRFLITHAAAREREWCPTFSARRGWVRVSTWGPACRPGRPGTCGDLVVTWGPCGLGGPCLGRGLCVWQGLSLQGGGSGGRDCPVCAHVHSMATWPICGIFMGSCQLQRHVCPCVWSVGSVRVHTLFRGPNLHGRVLGSCTPDVLAQRQACPMCLYVTGGGPPSPMAV